MTIKKKQWEGGRPEVKRESEERLLSSDRENKKGKIYDRKSDKNNTAKIMTTSILPFF